MEEESDIPSNDNTEGMRDNIIIVEEGTLQTLRNYLNIIQTEEEEGEEESYNFGERDFFCNFIQSKDIREETEYIFGDIQDEIENIIPYAFLPISPLHFTKTFKVTFLLSLFSPSDYAPHLPNPLFHNFIVSAKKFLPPDFISSLYSICGERINQFSSSNAQKKELPNNFARSNTISEGMKLKTKFNTYTPSHSNYLLSKMNSSSNNNNNFNKKFSPSISPPLEDRFHIDIEIPTRKNNRKSFIKKLSGNFTEVINSSDRSKRKTKSNTELFDNNHHQSVHEKLEISSPKLFSPLIFESTGVVSTPREISKKNLKPSSNNNQNNNNNVNQKKDLAEISFKSYAKEDQIVNISWSDISSNDSCSLELIIENENYVYEFGVPHDLQNESSSFSLLIDQLQSDFLFYQQIFYDNKHRVFGSKEPPSIIAITEAEKGAPTFIAIFMIDKTIRYTTKLSSRVKVEKVLSSLLDHLQLSHITFYGIKAATIRHSLAELESLSHVSAYKFGVIFCADGQTTENEMFYNKEGSEDFKEFLKYLGDEIDLLGWSKFRGGLDVTRNATGVKALYTKLRNYEIIYHVSTFLPHSESDVQQVERKRHLGNDVTIIVFKEGNQKFDPTSFVSDFNHVFFVVQKVSSDNSLDDNPSYRIEICCKNILPHPFRPFISSPPIIKADQTFRRWILTKLINSERMVMRSDRFQSKLLRAKRTLLSAVAENLK